MFARWTTAQFEEIAVLGKAGPSLAPPNMRTYVYKLGIRSRKRN